MYYNHARERKMKKIAIICKIYMAAEISFITVDIINNIKEITR